MKRLWLALSLILLIASAALLNAYSLTHITEELSLLLIEAQHAAEAGQTLEALRLTEQAEREFLKYGTYLHSTLNHQTIDKIQSSFSEVLERLRLNESNSVYTVANSALLIQLQLLAETEQLSLRNLL